MDRSGQKTFVGFGFGPIQSGLFLFEAYASGNFSRLVVAEVNAALVEAVRANGHRYTLNIARKDRIDQCEVAGVEVLNPGVPEDRQRLVDAVAQSDEISTSLPSVQFYNAGADTSVARILAEGLVARQQPLPTVVYAAENHNHAAELLRGRVEAHAPARALTHVDVLNTVIGKMSGVIREPDVIERMGLATMTPELPHAILVEEFNRILVSRVRLDGYRRGIDVFVEKDDLLPFEEAKLYGHNAIHALIAYLADQKGLQTIAEAGHDEEIMAIAREAFINESGAALIARHSDLGDPLFTPDGYRDYAEDLLERMVSPNLNDLVSRVGRDHVRKLGREDRFYGTMAIALEHGIEPTNLALGAAACMCSLIERQHDLPESVAHLPLRVSDLTHAALRSVLLGLWGGVSDPLTQRLVSLTWDAVVKLGPLRRSRHD